MGDSIHQSLSPSSVTCTNQEDSARQIFNRLLPLRPSVHGRVRNKQVTCKPCLLNLAWHQVKQVKFIYIKTSSKSSLPRKLAW
jgi:hypothetical protein